MSTATATQTTIRPAIYGIGEFVQVGERTKREFEILGIKLADRYVSRDCDLIDADEVQWAYLLGNRGTHEDGSGDVYLIDGWYEELDISGQTQDQFDRSKRVGQ